MRKSINGNNLQRIIGALKNGGEDAKMGILIHLLSPITQLIDSFILRKNTCDLENVKGIIISGPPRSGSTLIYQAITCALPCMPFTNLHALFPRHASNIVRHINDDRQASRTQFKNYHGYTSSLYDVNEGNYIFSCAHKTDNIEHLNKKFCEIISKLNPSPNEILIFKNVLAYNVLDRIYRATMDKQFVFIRVQRNPQAVIESALKVYKETRNFQPIPESLRKSAIDDPVDFAYQQIKAINATLDNQFKSIPENAKYVIQYEDFCKFPFKYLEKLAYCYFNLPKGSIKKCQALDSLKVSESVKVTKIEGEKIRDLLNIT